MTKLTQHWHDCDRPHQQQQQWNALQRRSCTTCRMTWHKQPIPKCEVVMDLEETTPTDQQLDCEERLNFWGWTSQKISPTLKSLSKKAQQLPTPWTSLPPPILTTFYRGIRVCSNHPALLWTSTYWTRNINSPTTQLTPGC